MQQQDFLKIHWQHRTSHGGALRNSRKGRKARPLNTKEPVHLVFKAHRSVLRYGLRSPRSFSLVQRLIQRYAKKFYIKIEQVSIQQDHLHFLIRTSRRSFYQSFFRVLAGQIAQQFEKEGLLKAVTDTPGGTSGRVQKAQKLWKYRPFTRVIKGWKAYQTVRNYIQLNEKEALGEIPYRKQRLRGLSSAEWRLLWS
jgi:putative transposase